MRPARFGGPTGAGRVDHGFLGRFCVGAERRLDETNFAKPLPWIGLFVAAASILLGLLLFLDFIRVIRKRKNLLTCRLLPLNAVSLTILAIATKLPVDLNTPMPGKFDQLSKLTGNIIICTVMGNFILSLVDMDPSSIFPNVVALAIFVVTVIVNICIQMGTGVIYIFWLEHIVAMLYMLFSLSLLVLSALAVPTDPKVRVRVRVLDDDDQPEGEEDEEGSWWPPSELEELMKRYWLLALTRRTRVDSWPLVKLSVELSFCSIIIVIMVLGASLDYTSWFCTGDSDYGWSTQVVFYSQVGIIMVGTHRVFVTALYFNVVWDAPMHRRLVDRFRLADHWIKQLHHWKYESLLSDNFSRHWRKIEYLLRSHFFHSVRRLTMDSTLLHQDPPMRRRSFLPRLEGQEECFLLDPICRKDVEKWIQKGKKQKPAELIRLLRTTKGGGFRGVARIFDSRVPSLVQDKGLREPQNCWVIPIVTLFSVAMTIPGVAEEDRESLLEAVHQGLTYVRFVEHHLDFKGLTCGARKEAKILWKSIEFHNKWFDQDLTPQVLDRVQNLANIGKQRFDDYLDENMLTRPRKRNCLHWSGKAIADYNMYKIAETIIFNRGPQLHDYDQNRNTFNWIRETISDTLSACLANLPRAIYVQCINSGHLHVEEKMRNVAFIFGETIEDIMPIFERQQEEMPNLGDDRRPYIDEWIKEVARRGTLNV